MVRGYHAIWAAYGFWLPNDPRGSWSTEVWASHLRCFGEATKTDCAALPCGPKSRRERLAGKPKRHLLYPPVRLTGIQAPAVGVRFASIIPILELRVYACSIMPDHVHLVIDRHPTLLVERTVEFLKGR